MTVTAAAAALTCQLDHLVVLASSLDEGVRWCENMLGITPGPGGEHVLMGTHNRLFNLTSPAFPDTYLEIIAINSRAHFARTSCAKRWFDMDSPKVQQQLNESGPQLAHFVARTARIEAGVRALATLGLDRGEIIAASRMTPQGPLDWKITVRPDGQRLLSGLLPTLIEWGKRHPASSMEASSVTLKRLEMHHPQPDALRAAYEAIGLAGMDVQHGAPNIMATLQTPRGLVTLESKGL